MSTKQSDDWRIVTNKHGDWVTISLLHPGSWPAGSCMCGGEVAMRKTPAGVFLANCLLCGRSATVEMAKEEAP